MPHLASLLSGHCFWLCCGGPHLALHMKEWRWKLRIKGPVPQPMLWRTSGFGDSAVMFLFPDWPLTKLLWVHLFPSPYLWVNSQGHTCFCSVGLGSGGMLGKLWCYCLLLSCDMSGCLQSLCSPSLWPCAVSERWEQMMLPALPGVFSSPTGGHLVALGMQNPGRSFRTRTWACRSGMRAGSILTDTFLCSSTFL